MKRNILLLCACLCIVGATGACRTTGFELDETLLTADNHPRVIFTAQDFAAAAALYEAGTNPYFSKIHEAVIARADACLDAPDLYRRFEGIRMTKPGYEADMRILCCAYAYWTTGERKYLEKAERDLRSVSAFEDWNHATHGLDVGEMAIGVGIGYDWLYNDLSEETKEMVRAALDNFAFIPYLTGTAQDPIYTRQFNNHNQVVNSGLVCSALAVYEDLPEHSHEIVRRAVESNIKAQQLAYSPDGNCREGYMYYTYGTLFETTMLTAMETTLGTDYGLSEVEGFRVSGRYMINMDGPSGYFFNYYDADHIFNMPCTPQWYFAWKYGDLSALYMEQSRLDRYIHEFRLLPVIAWYASKVTVTEIPAPAEHLYVGRGPTPVTLIHTTWTMDENDTFLGVLGGSADSPHAHEDAGSFVFDAEGVRWAADLGWQPYGIAEEHLKEFWNNRNGSDRWSVFRFKNQNHNTLTVNDAEHVSKAFAPITDSFYEDGRGGATVDLSETLGDQLASAVRTFRIEGDDLFVTDSLTALADKDACVRWTLVSRAEATLEDGGVTLRAGERTRYLSSDAGVDWTIWSAKAPNDWEEDNSDFHICGYTTTLKAGECATITVRLSKDRPE